MNAKRKWTYIVVLVAALITTFSTTGFLIFLCNFILFLYKSETVTVNGKLLIIAVGIVIVTVFASQFYSSFVKKINDYITADEYEFTWSAQTRSSQLKADIKVIKKHVFGLGQKKYLQEFKLEGRTDNKGSSNGVTKILAMYGLPIGLFIYCSYFWALRRTIGDPVLATGAFVMFMLFLAGEAYYTSATICYALIAAAFVSGPESVSEKNTIRHRVNTW